MCMRKEFFLDKIQNKKNSDNITFLIAFIILGVLLCFLLTAEERYNDKFIKEGVLKSFDAPLVVKSIRPSDYKNDSSKVLILEENNKNIHRVKIKDENCIYNFLKVGMSVNVSYYELDNMKNYIPYDCSTISKVNQ